MKKEKLIQKYRETNYVLLPLAIPNSLFQKVAKVSQVMHLENLSGKHKYQKNPWVSQHSTYFIKSSIQWFVKIIYLPDYK